VTPNPNPHVFALLAQSKLANKANAADAKSRADD
jgi:hypothetical protein